ncbi:uncharacterized protein LOC133525803 [Cydia pomonella]|uniref:uncharacterized protein LOC133525803 n=1 Tax=Cydia pomonella TaxID=82600 RepID=UPI002ADDF559|nr:uncharacterized protein LOC133525803 [Cydia pomonella]
MEKHHLHYVILFLIKFCHGSEPIYEENDVIELHKCVAMIIWRIKLGNITDVTLINADAQLAELLHSMPRPPRFVSRSFYWPHNIECNDVYVIRCEDYFAFAQGLDLVRRDPFWNPRAKFIITIEYMEDYLQVISEFLLDNHIYNVALVAYSQDQNMLVYTFENQYDECDRPIIKLLKPRFRCSDIHNIDIDKIFTYEKKTILRGCRVKFVSHDYWPFVSFFENYAIENYLLKLIRDYEGITVELVDFGKSEYFGGRLDNYTYTGMLHEIETYHVEGAVGGYSLNNNRMSNLDFIEPYMVNHYEIVIARAKLLWKWPAVLKQFGIGALLAIFGIFCIVCLTVTLMGIFNKQARDTSRDILIVWGYFFSNISQTQKAKSGVVYRMVLLSILVYVFVISYATQASLLSATTHPIREDQPNSAEEVISNYQVTVSPGLYAYLLRSPVINLNNVNTTCKRTVDCMMQVMVNYDQHLFTIVSDIYHKSYIWKFADENGESKIHTIREPIGTLLQTMYLRRGSSLTAPFNKLLRKVRSAGLLDRFTSRLHFSERLKYKFHARRGRQPHSLGELKGVFMILIYGYCISGISFILEYIYYLFMVYQTAFGGNK